MNGAIIINSIRWTREFEMGSFHVRCRLILFTEKCDAEYCE